MKNVVKTYFEDRFMAPVFELEDGTKMIPVIKNEFLIWMEESKAIEEVKAKKRENHWHSLPIFRMLL